MAIFGIEVGEEARDFMKLSEERLKVKTVIYSGFFKEYPKFWLIEMKPLILPFYWFGVMGLVGTYYFMGFTKLLLLPLPIALCCVLWNKYFYYVMLKIGLRKAGYKGKTKLLSNEELIKGLIQSDKVT